MSVGKELLVSILKLSLISASLFIAISSNGILGNEDGRSPHSRAHRSDVGSMDEESIITGQMAHLAVRAETSYLPTGVCSLSFDLAALLDESPGNVRINREGMVVIEKGQLPYSVYYFD